MGDNSKRAKTKWTELEKRTGDFAANNLTSVTFNAVHPFVAKLPWSELSLDDDPFRGGQMKVSVLIGILRGIMLPHMVPYLETFETGSEMQTRPWLLSMIASFLPLVTQSLNVGDTQIYLKAEFSDALRQQLQALASTLNSQDSGLGQVLRHEDATLWPGLHKADVTAFAYHKKTRAANKIADKDSRQVKLVAEAKTSLRNDAYLRWLNYGRHQNGDYVIRGAIWNAQNIPEESTVYGLGTSVEHYAPSAFKLEKLLKIEDGKVVAVPNNPIYVAPGAPGLDDLLKSAQRRVSLATETDSQPIPDKTYAVGKFYTTTKVVKFLDLPLEKTSTPVQEGALALVQALSIILCGKRAKSWSIEHVKAAHKAYQAALAEKIKRVQLFGAAEDNFVEGGGCNLLTD